MISRSWLISVFSISYKICSNWVSFVHWGSCQNRCLYLRILSSFSQVFSACRSLNTRQGRRDQRLWSISNIRLFYHIDWLRNVRSEILICLKRVIAMVVDSNFTLVGIIFVQTVTLLDWEFTSFMAWHIKHRFGNFSLSVCLNYKSALSRSFHLPENVDFCFTCRQPQILLRSVTCSFL